jgi:biopolymer transport protein ExbB/TolQ
MIKIMLDIFLLLAVFIIGFIFCYLLNILFSKRRIHEKEEYFEKSNIEIFKEKEEKPFSRPSFFPKEEKLTIDDLIKDFLKKNKDNEYLLKKKIQEAIKKAEDLFKEIEEYESKQN